MSETRCKEQLQLFEVGRQQVTMTIDGGLVVSDAGLLPIRELDKKLGILAEAARRLPDPRSERACTHSVEDILTRARTIVTKVKITQLGSTNVRFVVTNMSGLASGIYQGFYVQRGNVPERPIGELKNGLHMDRLSSHRFLANGHKLMPHLWLGGFLICWCQAAKSIVA